MTVLDLIDGRIAELDRLSAAASPDGSEAGGNGQELVLLLGALRALRRHKVADTGVPCRATPRRRLERTPPPARDEKR